MVRPATMEDASSLFHAWQRLRNHNAGIDRRFIPAPVSQDEFVLDLAELLRRPQSAAFVAELDRGLGGFISGRVEQNQPDRLPSAHLTVGYLWVEPRFRRRGIARALFDAVAAWGRGHDGVAHFEMAVLNADHAAAAFWRSIGFAPFIERLWAPLSAPEADA
ncbi:MAG: GNAT family N-acetyltransferase [Dehalococcoidia bacterium]|nr:GNAT family N-acetyltransferase [Dehalococcoidia bacterium]